LTIIFSTVTFLSDALVGGVKRTFLGNFRRYYYNLTSEQKQELAKKQKTESIAQFLYWWARRAFFLLQQKAWALHTESYARSLSTHALQVPFKKIA